MAQIRVTKRELLKILALANISDDEVITIEGNGYQDCYGYSTSLVAIRTDKEDLIEIEE